MFIVCGRLVCCYLSFKFSCLSSVPVVSASFLMGSGGQVRCSKRGWRKGGSIIKCGWKGGSRHKMSQIPLLTTTGTSGSKCHLDQAVWNVRMGEGARVRFGRARKKGKGFWMKQRARREHSLCDTRLTQACLPKL